MGTDSGNPVCEGEAPLPETWLLDWMRKYEFPKLDFDIPKMTRVMYEETKAALVFGAGAIVLDLVAFSLLKNQLVAGAPWLMIVPLSFLLLLFLLRPYEDVMLKLFIPSKIADRKGTSSDLGSSIRSHRIYQNLVLLGVILGVHFTSYTAFSWLSDGRIESQLRDSLKWGPYHYLIFFLRYARKFRGGCAMVVAYRIYFDVFLQSSHYFIGYPGGKDKTLSEPEGENMKLAHVQKSRSMRDAYNANLSAEAISE